jgi:hypothetical protein
MHKSSFGTLTKVTSRINQSKIKIVRQNMAQIHHILRIKNEIGELVWAQLVGGQAY